MINTESNIVIATVVVGDFPIDLAITGTSVYVSNSQSGNVSVIDTTNNTVMATVEVGGTPFALAITEASPLPPTPAPTLVVEAAVKKARGFGIRFKYYQLSWNAVPGATLYRIFRNGILISQDTRSTHYSDTAIDPSEAYTYVVDAYSSDTQIGSGQVQIGPL